MKSTPFCFTLFYYTCCLQRLVESALKMWDDVGTRSCLAPCPFVGLSGKKRSQEASNEERKVRKEKGRGSISCFFISRFQVTSHTTKPTFNGKCQFMMDDGFP
jgi:hypothetical protein